jgi:hypothetical protein
MQAHAAKRPSLVPKQSMESIAPEMGVDDGFNFGPQAADRVKDDTGCSETTDGTSPGRVLTAFRTRNATRKVAPLQTAHQEDLHSTVLKNPKP